MWTSVTISIGVIAPHNSLVRVPQLHYCTPRLDWKTLNHIHLNTSHDFTISIFTQKVCNRFNDSRKSILRGAEVIIWFGYSFARMNLMLNEQKNFVNSVAEANDMPQKYMWRPPETDQTLMAVHEIVICSFATLLLISMRYKEMTLSNQNKQIWPVFWSLWWILFQCVGQPGRHHYTSAIGASTVFEILSRAFLN